MRASHILGAVFRGGAVAPPSGAEPLKIRQGFVAITAAFTPLVFEHKEVMKHYGTSYVLETEHFQGTSSEITAIAAGEVDLITIGFSTLAVGVERAGLDLRIVADGFQDGVDDYFSSHYVVRSDSGINRVEDLKGKVLATNGIGGSLDVALRAMLKQARARGQARPVVDRGRVPEHECDAAVRQGRSHRPDAALHL